MVGHYYTMVFKTIIKVIQPYVESFCSLAHENNMILKQ